MADWNHRICGECWIEGEMKSKDPDADFVAQVIRAPVMAISDPSICCFCGGKTRLGIFIRQDPATLKCKHDD